MITLYGIKNCDTIKKARAWLNDAGVEYRFHDFRADGLPEALLEAWLDELGFEVLINKRGTTWRQLPETVKDGLDRNSAKQIMLDNPAIIKRPVLDLGTSRVIGFKAADYQTLFSNQTA